MKRLPHFFALITACFSQCALASTGLFFNITATGGAPTPLEFTLCLNALSPATCQSYGANHLNLQLTTTVPNHTYDLAGIKFKTPGYSLTGCTMLSNGYCLFTVSQTTVATIGITQSYNPNAPWYPSLEAFEHYNSGRSHVFSLATFGGSMTAPNTVNTLSSPTSYPSGYNMSYLNSDLAYLYGGGYGNIAGSIGAYVAQLNPNTLEPIWYNQLIDTSSNGEWDYPGSMGILTDGYIYVSYGYRLAKLDPATGNVITTLVLPTGGGLPENTSFNGFDATSDGTIVMMSLYRQAGCGIQGPDALLNCPDPSDVPPSILVSVNPQTMQVIDNITLPASVAARPTVSEYNNQQYVYLIEPTTASRYLVQKGVFTLDNSWNPGTLTLAGQTFSTSFTVVNDWVVTQTNALPASTALTVISINQGNASQQFSIQPFAGDFIPPYISAAFSTAGPAGSQAISWAPMSVSGDPATNLVYASDALPGEIAAIALSQTGLSLVWKVDQRTTEFTTLINPEATRVLVGTSIPSPEIPGNNLNDIVVWRNALTGAEIAHSPSLPAMTPGTMIQPYYSGDMFYEGQSGSLIKLSPTE